MQEALEQWKQMAWARESGIGEQEFPAGALYIVGLPIGDAEDSVPLRHHDARNLSARI